MQKENGIRAFMPEEELISLYPEDTTRYSLIRRVDHYNRAGLITLEEGAEILRLGEDDVEDETIHPVYEALAGVRDFGRVATAAAFAAEAAQEATV